jgi:hypothetical protein
VRQETEREEEIYVRNLLGKRYGACLHKIPKSEQEGVKTPDYELLVTHVRVAVLEVKRLVRTPRTLENGWQLKVSANGIREATRADNAPQRVGKLIHEAWKQLRTVRDPKILVFVNDETQMDTLDLQEAFNGFLHYGNDSLGYYKNTTSAKVANGAIREEKWENFGLRPRPVLTSRVGFSAAPTSENRLTGRVRRTRRTGAPKALGDVL